MIPELFHEKSGCKDSLLISFGPASLDVQSSFQYGCNRITGRVQNAPSAFVMSRLPIATSQFFLPVMNERVVAAPYPLGRCSVLRIGQTPRRSSSCRDLQPRRPLRRRADCCASIRPFVRSLRIRRDAQVHTRSRKELRTADYGVHILVFRILGAPAAHRILLCSGRVPT